MKLRWGLRISGGAQGIHRQLGPTGIHSPLAETCLHRATGPMPESSQKSCECIQLLQKHQRNTHVGIHSQLAALQKNE